MVILEVGLAVGLLVVLAMLRSLRCKLDAVPEAVWWKLSTRGPVREDEAAVAAASEAASTRAVALVAGVQAYHDRLDASVRAQLVAADRYARQPERRAADVGVALDAGSALVRELRALVDRLSPPAAPATTSGKDQERRTAEVPRRPSPAVAPPGSAPRTSPKPAQIAAGLGPRPQNARPHAPSREESPPPLPSATADERPEEEEVTCVADRPPPELLGTAKTLASMDAVAPGEEESAT